LCNQKADYDLFLKEFEDINLNIQIIKTNLNLSGSYSKNEEIFDILNVPHQLILALINMRIDLFNEIFNQVKKIYEKLNNKDNLIENIYLLCTKIKIIFMKSIIKSILLENIEKLDNFFHLHTIYNFQDLYILFSDQDFFQEFLFENMLIKNSNSLTNEKLPKFLLENFHLICFIIFKLNLIIGNFINQFENIKINFDEYFSLENKIPIRENLILKDFYCINNLFTQITKNNLSLIIFILRIINEIFLKDEKSNIKIIENSNLTESKSNSHIFLIYNFKFIN